MQDTYRTYLAKIAVTQSEINIKWPFSLKWIENYKVGF